MNSEDISSITLTAQQGPIEDNTKSYTGTLKATSLPLPSFGGFNTEEFLARVNMNEKINAILRSPPRSANGIRQRSIYTAISSTASPPRTRFNSASSLNGTLTNGYTPALAAAFNANGISKEAAVAAALPQRQPPFSMHIGSAATHYNGFDTTLNNRNASISRALLNGRYSMGPAPPPLYGFDNDIIRLTSSITPSPHAQQFPQPMPPPPYMVGRLNGHRGTGLDYDAATASCPGAGPIAMTNGTIQLRLRDGVRIDMTLDKAVRVVNQRSMVAIALSRNCSNSALIHPNGRVLQSGSKVELVTYDGMKTNNYVRYAKMWYKGVSFTSESCALIYLVDTAGTRTTTDTFTDLTKDYTLAVFYDDSRHGPSFMKEANEIIQNSLYTCTDEGTEVYEINGFRITQAADGLVKLTRTHNKCLIRTSPSNGSATLTTPGIHCTASLGKTSHLFVRRNEKRMHFDGSCFIVRNAGHSAGFNENNLLIVY